MNDRFFYVASPYSHPSMDVMAERYRQACRAAAGLMELGYSVFAPIAHSHPIAAYMDPKARVDFDLWMRQDLPVLRHATEMWVLNMDGWRESRGVTRELAFAAEHGIPVRFLDPVTLDFIDVAVAA